MGTKLNPSTFDCYANAEPDEPMFILLARDKRAPEIVRQWIAAKRLTSTDDLDEAKFAEAESVAKAMEEWREKNRG